jgi:hypothetical protein
VLYLEDGRTAEVKVIAAELTPIFAAQRVARETLRPSSSSAAPSNRRPSPPSWPAAARLRSREKIAALSRRGKADEMEGGGAREKRSVV